MCKITKTTLTSFPILIGLVLLCQVLASCESQNTYANLREQEKKSISDYIAREHINVLNEWPSKWGEKDYYKITGWDDDVYIHVIEQDSASKQVKAGDIIVTRYKKYGLGSYSDTTVYWTVDDGGNPIEFQLGNTSDTYYIKGWTAALLVMKYSESHCRIICPSKMGVSEDNSSVTPYGYELKFKKKQ